AAPSHPEESGDCFCPLLHRRFQVSSFSGRLATLFLLRNEAETGSLVLRLACSPRKASPALLPPPTLARLLAERAIYKISSFQNIRSARLSLALPKTQSTLLAKSKGTPSDEPRPSSRANARDLRKISPG